ncbi:MAG: FlgD immunoglobulin-like domain containing protein [Candidatus Zhuqueibacterota bacterium]
MKKNSSVIRMLISFFSLLIAMAATAQEAPMFCREFRVGNGARPVVAALANGNFVICWAGEYQHIFGRIFDKNGNSISSDFQVSTTNSERESEPRIAALKNGNFIVCWGVYKEEPNKNADIYAQRIAADGTKIGEEFIPCANPELHLGQNWCDAAGLNNGDFVIVWESQEEDGWSGGLFGQRFSGDGEHLGEQFQLNSFPEVADERLVNVAPYGEDGFVAVWHRRWKNCQSRISHEEIGFQRFDAANSPVWVEKTIHSREIHSDCKPDLCSLEDGSVIVCWYSYAGVPDQYIWAQQFDENGNEPGPVFQVNDANSRGAIEQCIAALNSGEFVVLWRNGREERAEGGTQQVLDIYGQLFDSATEKVSEVFRINSISDVTLRYNLPHATALGDSGFVVVFQEMWSGIHCKVFSTDSIDVASNEDDTLPVTFILHEGFPNPFRQRIQMKYELPERSGYYFVRIKIFNSIGRLVKTLFSNFQTFGFHEIEWDGTDSDGSCVSNGIYFCHMAVNDVKKTTKFTFLH